MNIFQKVWKWIGDLFGKIEKKVEELIPIATNVVEGVKRAIENDQILTVIEWVKFAIPGDTDDKIIDKVLELTKEYIPKIALQLQIINSITDIEDKDKQMIAVLDVLKNASKKKKAQYWHELAKQVLYALSDDKITWGEAASFVEYDYRNRILKQ